MLSAVQHYAFCPRQCALIHLEQLWQENGHTALGRLMHETAHGGSRRMRGGVKVVTDLEVCSFRLGLHGRADVVEFQREEGGWRPYPVEYKKGRPHAGSDADAVQLCAQALCLEEMLGTDIPEGALFYGEARRRRQVAFDGALRARTEAVVAAVRAMLASGGTPPPTPRPWCGACSLLEWCLPELPGGKASAYVRSLCEEGP
ncbi:CRISPR-associated protein Cas4 [uncultured Desulfovibrio sp.]|uniref:CRISPR-associated protein Cas4 n=1 Tax=uncultured Desulfovibrio sp. TaxID=167968 RepID=UPI0028065406|nr:CRISPR-associated protein Cas4 [uncultured Desulfovibrio sp.]